MKNPASVVQLAGDAVDAMLALFAILELSVIEELVVTNVVFCSTFVD